MKLFGPQIEARAENDTSDCGLAGIAHYEALRLVSDSWRATLDGRLPVENSSSSSVALECTGVGTLARG